MSATASLVPVPEEERDLEQKALTLTERAATLAVTDQPGYEAANELLRAAKAGESAVRDYFAEIVDRAHKAWKGLVAKREEALAPWIAAKDAIESEMGRYVLAEAERRKAEQRRLEEEARRRAEEEKLAEAIHLEEQGATEEAAAVLDTPVEAPVVIMPAAPKAENLSTTFTFAAEVVEFERMVCYIAGVQRLAHPELLSLLTCQGPSLNNKARAEKDGFRLPGCRLVKKPKFTSR